MPVFLFTLHTYDSWNADRTEGWHQHGVPGTLRSAPEIARHRHANARWERVRIKDSEHPDLILMARDIAFSAELEDSWHSRVKQSHSRHHKLDSRTCRSGNGERHIQTTACLAAGANEARAGSTVVIARRKARTSERPCPFGPLAACVFAVSSGYVLDRGERNAPVRGESHVTTISGDALHVGRCSLTSRVRWPRVSTRGSVSARHLSLQRLLAAQRQRNGMRRTEQSEPHARGTNTTVDDHPRAVDAVNPRTHILR